MGTLAMFATDDADSCRGILERVTLRHDESVSDGGLGDPYFYADRVAETASQVLSATFGSKWPDDAPQRMFVVAGWHTSGDVSVPVVLRLHQDYKFEPKPLEGPWGVWGSGSAIAKYLLEQIMPDYPLSPEQMVCLSFLLIQESARKMDGVGDTAYIHIIKPGENPRPLTMDEFRTASRVANSAAWCMAESGRAALSMPARTTPDFLT